MSNHSHPRRRAAIAQQASKGTAAGAALLALASVGLVLSGSASAQTLSPYEFHGSQISSDTFAGNFNGIPGIPGGSVYCSTPGGTEPNAETSGDYALIGQRASSGATLTTEQLAYLYETYKDSTDDTIAQAIYWETELNLNGATQSGSSITTTDPAQSTYGVNSGVLDTMNDLVAEAQANAGPYAVEFTAPPQDIAIGGTYTFSETVTVRSASGAVVARPVDVFYSNASGPATVTGGDTFSVTAGPDTNFSFSISGSASGATQINEYGSTVTQSPMQNQNVVGSAGLTAGPVTSVEGNFDPIIAASFTKLIAG